MPFDGLGRIGELSGQISADEWNEILGSTDELKKKHPELTKNTSEAMELIRERSLSFEDLESSDTIDWLLWEMGEAKRENSHEPHHRTRTIFY